MLFIAKELKGRSVEAADDNEKPKDYDTLSSELDSFKKDVNDKLDNILAHLRYQRSEGA